MAVLLKKVVLLRPTWRAMDSLMMLMQRSRGIHPPSTRFSMVIRLLIRALILPFMARRHMRLRPHNLVAVRSMHVN